MARELLILRHGKSDWSTDANDYDRPITNRGERDAQRIGTWLLSEGLCPDYIITSPANRALSTTQNCCSAMGLSTREIVQEPRIYEASVKLLTQVLSDIPTSSQRVMLVGHNPGLEMLLEFLIGRHDLSEYDDGKLLPTATLAQLQLPDRWDDLASKATLHRVLRPKSLPRGFPYPTPHGSEMRDRPAYYYTQISVIPYRQGEEGIEVLLLASSKRHHYIIPLGIQQPGESPHTSTTQIAWEEAGVAGSVAADPIGKYLFNKWGGECSVSVYAMEVTHATPERGWEITHRQREWHPLDVAADLIWLPELHPILKQLPHVLEHADG